MRHPLPASHRLSIAPMLDWTDRHARYFLRLISPHAFLYSEMVTTGAILHGNAEQHLAFHAEEHPVALQLGGSDPGQLAKACRIAQPFGYDEININVGCPSNRVQSGRFGACLMVEPKLVADCVSAMMESSCCPVSVKCRIGIDDKEDFSFLERFITTVAATGCTTFIIHARKAILTGLSPKENREIPPLRYEYAYRAKQLFPHLEIVINGGITDASQCREHLHHTDGVMIGRAAYHDPWCLTEMESALFPDAVLPTSRHAVMRQMIPYIEKELAAGTRLNHISRHLLGIFNNQPGARAFRQYISTHAHKKEAGLDVLLRAMALVPEKQ
jgi:tRNA-dihydrouridine synthase A